MPFHILPLKGGVFLQTLPANTTRESAEKALLNFKDPPGPIIVVEANAEGERVWRSPKVVGPKGGPAEIQAAGASTKNALTRHNEFKKNMAAQLNALRKQVSAELEATRTKFLAEMDKVRVAMAAEVSDFITQGTAQKEKVLKPGYDENGKWRA